MRTRNRLTLAAALLLAASISIHAQVPDQYKGVFRLYDFSAPRKDAPAPKGYKAFSISHYGRHGARYLSREGYYSAVVDLFTSQAAAGNLTAFGQEYWTRMQGVLPSFLGRAGDLTDLGAEQHRTLGARMYRQYPSIFRHNPEITATTSTTQRCAMSMVNFCEGMAAQNPRLDIYKTIDSRDMAFCNPYAFLEKDKADYRDFNRAYFGRKVDVRPIYTRLFRDPDAAIAAADSFDFVRNLCKFACHMQCTEFPDVNFDDAFTPEEIAAIYDVENQRFYLAKGYGMVSSPTRMYNFVKPLVDKVIADAERDTASERPTVRLRFGHDGIIQAFLAYLHIDRWGDRPESPEDVINIWSNSAIPMACNMRFVFYRDRKGDVIFKFQLNESDVQLPLKAVEGPFYRWADFVEYAGKLALAQ